MTHSTSAGDDIEITPRTIALTVLTIPWDALHRMLKGERQMALRHFVVSLFGEHVAQRIEQFMDCPKN